MGLVMLANCPTGAAHAGRDVAVCSCAANRYLIA